MTAETGLRATYLVTFNHAHQVKSRRTNRQNERQEKQMSTPWIITLSILGAFIVIPPIVQVIVLLSLKHQASSTEWYLMDRLRYIVYVTGQVRAGKTTFAAGYTNIRTKALIRKAQNKVEFTCLAVPEVPFDEADRILEEDFRDGEADAWKEARKLVSEGMPFEAYRNTFYDNHVAAHPVPFVKLLETYINAYFALLRNNYVYFYGKNFYSRITFNDAMDYDPSMLNIKDRIKSGDYHIYPYSVIFEDERQLSGKDNTQYRAYAKADTGASDFLRLIGQIGQESIYYVTTNQYWGTDVNRERDLATDIVCMDSSWAVNPFFLPRFFISLYEMPWKFMKWLRRHKKCAISPLEEKSRYRKELSRAMLWRKYWASKGYVKFRGVIYHSASDVGKTDQYAAKRVDHLKATIPLIYCYGSVNTFQFYSVQRELMSSSKWKMKDEPETITDEEMARRVLRKREEILSDAEAKKGNECKAKQKKEKEA